MLSLNRNFEPPRVVIGTEPSDTALAKMALSQQKVEQPMNGNVFAPGSTLDASISVSVLAGLTGMAMQGAKISSLSDEGVAETISFHPQMNDEAFAGLVELAASFVNQLIDDPA